MVNLLTAALLLVLADGVVRVPGAGPVQSSDDPSGQSLPLASLTGRLDALYAQRDDQTAFAEQQRLVASALTRAPQDYELLWRAARVSFWHSDDPTASLEERSARGKTGWELAERAIAVNPGGVAGHFYAAACMGNYALGLGLVKALSMGMERKFKERLQRAGELDARYQHGSIAIAWGRFFDKLPWPKRDRNRAAQQLREALRINPHSLRARVFLAESLIGADRPREAKPLLDEVRAAPVGRYDAPEERRAKSLAAGLMPQLLAKLK